MVLLRSFIRLMASDICFASGIASQWYCLRQLRANKIPLKPKALISLLIYQKYHSVRSTEYHLYSPLLQYRYHLGKPCRGRCPHRPAKEVHKQTERASPFPTRSPLRIYRRAQPLMIFRFVANRRTLQTQTKCIL